MQATQNHNYINLYGKTDLVLEFNEWNKNLLKITSIHREILLTELYFNCNFFNKLRKKKFRLAEEVRAGTNGI